MAYFSIPYRGQEELYGLAHGILQTWSALESVPVEIEHFVEKHNNIICLPSRSIARLCDSGGAISLDRSVIYVDWECYHLERLQYRLRMTVAHEFAHARLHSSILGAIKSEDDQKELLAFFTENPNSYSRYEAQAFMLAGFLLVPDQTLFRVTQETVETLKKADDHVDFGTDVTWMTIAKEIARKYVVTPKVTAFRLKYSGFWGNPITE